MQVGDLVAIKSNTGSDIGKVCCTGIYLGTETTWKDSAIMRTVWHLVYDMKGGRTKWDEPFWQLEVLSEKKT